MHKCQMQLRTFHRKNNFSHGHLNVTAITENLLEDADNRNLYKSEVVPKQYDLEEMF